MVLERNTNIILRLNVGELHSCTVGDEQFQQFTVSSSGANMNCREASIVHGLNITASLQKQFDRIFITSIDGVM